MQYPRCKLTYLNILSNDLILVMKAKNEKQEAQETFFLKPKPIEKNIKSNWLLRFHLQLKNGVSVISKWDVTS